MASNPMIRRYKIFQYIKYHHYPSKKDIIDFLKTDGIPIGFRTLEDDFEIIRADFRQELKYNKKYNGYYIDKEESDQYDSFFRFIEIATIAEIFNESLKDNKKILEYVSFDDSKSFHGIENLKKILLAISQERKLLFKHLNYKLDTINNYEIAPLLLKEYENRWYILGVIGGKDEVWSFGIDRISDLSIGELYQIDKEFYKKNLEKYKDIIGVSFEPKDPKEKVKIELLVHELHVKYLRSLPLHHSQEIDPNTKNGKNSVTFFLIPNYEFKTQILKMGDYAEVISPGGLRDEIKGMLRNALERYE